MPYISPNDRPYLDPFPSTKLAFTPGQLNFQITKLINEYLATHQLRYTYINDCIGVLECAKLELYRRIAAGYEDKQMEENGDVYTQAKSTTK